MSAALVTVPITLFQNAACLRIIDDMYAEYGELPMAILITSVTFCVALIAGHMIGNILRHQLSGSPVAELSILTNIVRAIIAVIVVFFLGENVFDIEMGGLIQAMGVTTLVVSLGLQDLIKSVVAGLLIVAGQIVAIGDQVILGEHRGEVMDVNWHQITIRDRDGIDHVIPNSKLLGDTFMRLQGKMACRHIFECDIVPGVDLNLVKTDIETLAANVLTKNGWIAPGYAPQVLFLGSSAFGTNASVRVFISDIEYATRAMDAVMCAISNRGYLADCTHDVNSSWKHTESTTSQPDKTKGLFDE